MRALISVDMEGVAGVVDPAEIWPGNGEYERNRGYMTDEASAAVRGVLLADPSASVVVCDAHAMFRNLLPDRLERRATLVRGAPRRHGMVTGIDAGVDVVLLVGHHGAAGTATSVLAHTVSGGTLAEVRCNGTPLGEIGLSCLLAVHYGAVPVLVTGDDTAAREAALLAPGITTVAVKTALGNCAAESLHPLDACERIEAGAADAVRAREAVRLSAVEGPVEVEVDLLRTVMTDRVARIPGARVTAPRTVAFTAPDFPAAYDLIDVVATVAAAT